MTEITAEPRRFKLVRTEDVTGMSGTGVVAYGVEFGDGRTEMRWCTEVRSNGSYDSIADLIHIHGHGGATVVEWIDFKEDDPAELIAQHALWATNGGKPHAAE